MSPQTAQKESIRRIWILIGFPAIVAVACLAALSISTSNNAAVVVSSQILWAAVCVFFLAETAFGEPGRSWLPHRASLIVGVILGAALQQTVPAQSGFPKSPFGWRFLTIYMFLILWFASRYVHVRWKSLALAGLIPCAIILAFDFPHYIDGFVEGATVNQAMVTLAIAATLFVFIDVAMGFIARCARTKEDTGAPIRFHPAMKAFLILYGIPIGTLMLLPIIQMALPRTASEILTQVINEWMVWLKYYLYIMPAGFVVYFILKFWKRSPWLRIVPILAVAAVFFILPGAILFGAPIAVVLATHYFDQDSRLSFTPGEQDFLRAFVRHFSSPLRRWKNRWSYRTAALLAIGITLGVIPLIILAEGPRRAGSPLKYLQFFMDRRKFDSMLTGFVDFMTQGVFPVCIIWLIISLSNRMKKCWDAKTLADLRVLPVSSWDIFLAAAMPGMAPALIFTAVIMASCVPALLAHRFIIRFSGSGSRMDFLAPASVTLAAMFLASFFILAISRRTTLKGPLLAGLTIIVAIALAAIYYGVNSNIFLQPMVRGVVNGGTAIMLCYLPYAALAGIPRAMDRMFQE